MEDLLEEIVGNIYDEFDSEEPPEIVQLEDNLWRISGGAYVEDIAEALDLDLPEDIDYDTLGGMIFSCLRIIPADGSQFDVQVNGLNIHVEKWRIREWNLHWSARSCRRKKRKSEL